MVAENVQCANDGIGAAVEALVVSKGIGDQDDALGSAGGGRHGDEFLGKTALKRGEAEVAANVVAEDETDDSVTKGTDAVVEDNRAAFDLGSFRFRHRCGRSDSYTV